MNRRIEVRSSADGLVTISVFTGDAGYELVLLSGHADKLADLLEMAASQARHRFESKAGFPAANPSIDPAQAAA